MGAEFDECGELLHEAEYTAADVQKHVLQPLHGAVQHLVRDEHAHVVNMVVLLLKQVGLRACGWAGAAGLAKFLWRAQRKQSRLLPGV